MVALRPVGRDVADNMVVARSFPGTARRSRRPRGERVGGRRLLASLAFLAGAGVMVSRLFREAGLWGRGGMGFVRA